VNRTYLKTVERVIAAALVIAFARPAGAADPATAAEALVRQGLQLRAQNEPGRALPLFEQAYRIDKTPRTAAHLGLVELELEDYVEAERFLTEALATPTHPWIAKNKTTLEQQLATARANVGELAITGSPNGAEIWVDGARAGQLPLSAPLRLSKGRVDLQVRAAGHLPATETLNIVAGKREQRSYVLAPDPALARAPSPPYVTRSLAAPAAPTAPPPFAASAVPATPSDATTIEATASEPGDPRRTMRTAAWVTGGAAVAALVFGTVELFQVASARDAFNDHMGTVGGVYGKDCGTGSLSAECKPLKDDYDHAVTLSVVGFAAAGALAAGASVLYLLSSPERGVSSERAESARALACVPDPAGRGVACSLRF
jgi:hypothetical protein